MTALSLPTYDQSCCNVRKTFTPTSYQSTTLILPIFTNPAVNL
jgi:hypothetical protein